MPTDQNEEIFSHLSVRVTKEDNKTLMAIPSHEEIWEVVRSMKPNKPSGPDGFPVSFFKHNWSLVGDQLVGLIKEFWETKKIKS